MRTVELSLQIECSRLVRDVSWRDKKREYNPQQKCIDSEERSVIQQDAAVAKDRAKQTEGCRRSGDDELGGVSDANDAGIRENIEPSKET